LFLGICDGCEQDEDQEERDCFSHVSVLVPERTKYLGDLSHGY
jgi:hypothetical protein